MLTKQEDNFSKWFNELVIKADLAEYSSVKGCMIIKPYGYSIWENIQKNLDRKIKQAGVVNAYFPLLVPESFLKKEAEHVKGFSPEVAWVTYGGQKKLAERLALRPTSETIIYDAFSRWVQSYRDLPLKINQWANIVRWEMKPRLFLRTIEFLWQEGHTAHSTDKEATQETQRALQMYFDFMRDYLAICTIKGRKTESEKFAGAEYTLSVESLMKDGKALQMGTSHNLGQNFAKSFDITFLNQKGENKYVWQTSWGVSTRLIGGLIMSHGDNKGLVLPPQLAPHQVVIVPIFSQKEAKAKDKKYVEQVAQILSKQEVRFLTDWREQTPGWKFNEWELRGVPLRIEIGAMEVKNKKLTIYFRDQDKRQEINLDLFEKKIKKMLTDFQKRLYQKSVKFTKEKTQLVKNMTDFKKAIKRGGFIKAHWCGQAKCEASIKQATQATIRCIPEKQSSQSGQCLKCGQKANLEVLFAKSY